MRETLDATATVSRQGEDDLDQPLRSYAKDCGCAHASEPLLAVYESDGEISVTGMGELEASELKEVPAATSIRVIDFTKSKGKTEAVVRHNEEIGACEGPACLPWIRIAKDPNTFRKCLAAARALGQIKYSRDIYRCLTEHLISQDQETFVVVLLDRQNYVMAIGEIARGARDSVQVPIPDVLRLPIVAGATSFVVAHNHPSGNTTPSDADIELTRSLARAAEEVDLVLLDHLVMGANGYHSFMDQGFFTKKKKTKKR